MAIRASVPENVREMAGLSLVVLAIVMANQSREGGPGAAECHTHIGIVGDVERDARSVIAVESQAHRIVDRRVAVRERDRLERPLCWRIGKFASNIFESASFRERSAVREKGIIRVKYTA